MPALAFLFALGLQLAGTALAMVGAIAFVSATPRDMAEAAMRLPALARLNEAQFRTALAGCALLGFAVFVAGATMATSMMVGR